MARGWDDIVGKHVVVGLTYVDSEGELLERTQKHGVVVRADDDGVWVQPTDGEEFGLPPDLDGFEEAVSGDYRLRGTGEVVTDPDFVVSYTTTVGGRG